MRFHRALRPLHHGLPVYHRGGSRALRVRGAVGGGVGGGRASGDGPGRVDPADIGYLLDRDWGVLHLPGGVPAFLPGGDAREVPRLAAKLGRHRALVRTAQPGVYDGVHVRRPARLLLAPLEALLL